MEERYNRQNLIEGWDQEKLADAKVSIIGSGLGAQYTAVSLAALGIGNITIYNNASNDGSQGLLYQANEKSKAEALAGFIRKINPLVNVREFSVNDLESRLDESSGIVIDLTQSDESKSRSYNAAVRHGLTFINAQSTEYDADIEIVKAGEEYQVQADYKGEEGAVTSGVLGGILCEEVRKIVMPLSQNDVPVKRLHYSLNSNKRFSRIKDSETKKADLRDKKVLIVGAGALGNFAGLASVLEGIGHVDIMDYDSVETTNLNRQVLFYDSVGRNKSEALAEKLKMINPSTEVNGIVGKLDENSDYFESNKPDLIIDCVDSFAVRAVINYFAVRNQIPLVSGGTDPRSGQVIVYQPGQSSCLECRLGVEKALAVKRSGASCKDAPDPSVIMTNQVIGSMIVGEAIKLLSIEKAVKRTLKYDSTIKARGGLVDVEEACECKKPEVEQWLAQVDELMK